MNKFLEKSAVDRYKSVYAQNIKKYIECLSNCDDPELRENYTFYLKKILHEHVTGHFIWPKIRENCYTGCSYDCKYCSSKSKAVKSNIKTENNWKEEILIENKFDDDYMKKHHSGIIFPADHDITTDNLDDCIEFMTSIMRMENRLVIYTKPSAECIMIICRWFQIYWDVITFCFSIGSSKADTLKYWEPSAPDFDERLESLKYAYYSGFKTFVSCEPILDDHIEDVIEKVSPFVTNEIMLNKPVQLLHRMNINGHGSEEAIGIAKMLTSSLSDQYIIELYSKFSKDPKIRWGGGMVSALVKSKVPNIFTLSRL